MGGGGEDAALNMRVYLQCVSASSLGNRIGLCTTVEYGMTYTLALSRIECCPPNQSTQVCDFRHVERIGLVGEVEFRPLKVPVRCLIDYQRCFSFELCVIWNANGT
jgi:hypothetical protein